MAELEKRGPICLSKEDSDAAALHPMTLDTSCWDSLDSYLPHSSSFATACENKSSLPSETRLATICEASSHTMKPTTDHVSEVKTQVMVHTQQQKASDCLMDDLPPPPQELLDEIETLKQKKNAAYLDSRNSDAVMNKTRGNNHKDRTSLCLIHSNDGRLCGTAGGVCIRTSMIINPKGQGSRQPYFEQDEAGEKRHDGRSSLRLIQPKDGRSCGAASGVCVRTSMIINPKEQTSREPYCEQDAPDCARSEIRESQHSQKYEEKFWHGELQDAAEELAHSTLDEVLTEMLEPAARGEMAEEDVPICLVRDTRKEMGVCGEQKNWRHTEGFVTGNRKLPSNAATAQGDLCEEEERLTLCENRNPAQLCREARLDGDAVGVVKNGTEDDVVSTERQKITSYAEANRGNLNEEEEKLSLFQKLNWPQPYRVIFLDQGSPLE